VPHIRHLAEADILFDRPQTTLAKQVDLRHTPLHVPETTRLAGPSDVAHDAIQELLVTANLLLTEAPHFGTVQKAREHCGFDESALLLGRQMETRKTGTQAPPESTSSR
jgi:hypothetical protein